MSDVSERALVIATNYLGPAAKRFLERQCKLHLNVEFDNINRTNLPDLAKWVKTSATFITDAEKAERLGNEISRI